MLRQTYLLHKTRWWRYTFGFWECTLNPNTLYVAVNQLKCLISYFKGYRKNRFTSAMNSSKNIASEMEIEPMFCQKRIIYRKKNLMKMLIIRKHYRQKNRVCACVCIYIYIYYIFSIVLSSPSSSGHIKSNNFYHNHLTQQIEIDRL